jgi:hypothetical protein
MIIFIEHSDFNIIYHITTMVGINQIVKANYKLPAGTSFSRNERYEYVLGKQVPYPFKFFINKDEAIKKGIRFIPFADPTCKRSESEERNRNPIDIMANYVYQIKILDSIKFWKNITININDSDYGGHIYNSTWGFYETAMEAIKKLGSKVVKDANYRYLMNEEWKKIVPEDNDHKVSKAINDINKENDMWVASLLPQIKAQVKKYNWKGIVEDVAKKQFGTNNIKITMMRMFINAPRRNEIIKPNYKSFNLKDIYQAPSFLEIKIKINGKEFDADFSNDPEDKWNSGIDTKWPWSTSGQLVDHTQMIPVQIFP